MPPFPDRAVLWRIIMPIISRRPGDLGFLAGILIAGLIVVAMGRLGFAPVHRRPAGPAAVRVTGTIRLDGKAMPDGIVAFDGQDGTAAVLASVVTGSFTLVAPPGEKVVIVDRYRVGGHVDESGAKIGESSLPIRYNAASTLRAVVRAEGPNEFHFDVHSK